MEDRGEIPQGRQIEGRRADRRAAQGLPRLRRALDRRPAQAVHPAGLHGRMVQALHHDGLPRRGGDRRRVAQVRRQQAALSRLPPRDVVAGREDRAGRGRGRVSRQNQPDDLCEVSALRSGVGGPAPRSQSAQCQRRDLDDDAMDHPRQSRHRLFDIHPLRRLSRRSSGSAVIAAQ